MLGDIITFANAPICAIDTETTGLSHIKNRVFEVAAVRQENGKRTYFTAIVDPGVQLEPVITTLTGATDAEIARRAIPHKEAFTKFAEMMDGATLVAHNAPFDIGFIAAEFWRHSIPMPSGRVLDTLKLSRSLLKNLPKHRLGDVYEHLLGKRMDKAHRATEDAEACLDILEKLVELTPSGSSAPVSQLYKSAMSKVQFKDNLPEAAGFAFQSLDIQNWILNKARVSLSCKGMDHPPEGYVGVIETLTYDDRFGGRHFLIIEAEGFGRRLVAVSDVDGVSIAGKAPMPPEEPKSEIASTSASPESPQPPPVRAVAVEETPFD